MTYPDKHALYDPRFEHDACGVGLVVDIAGRRSHQIVLDAEEVLKNMHHRGATGAEHNTGDGAGISTGLPHSFLRKVARRDLDVDLPEVGRFAAGNVFLPRDADERRHVKWTFERVTREQGQCVLGWRPVPIDLDGADVGATARAHMPEIEQLFVAAGADVTEPDFERALYVIRKRAGTALRNDARLREAARVYVCTLSTRVLVYKGMLTPHQLVPFYPDLADWDYRSHMAMVHSRFSTNTFPSWSRAQPLRCMSHNGEINTLRGNVNSMNDRESALASPLFGDDLPKLFPIAEPATSDSGNFDNVLELLLMAGRSLPEAIMMMIPEAWQKDASMSDDKRAFYEYHSMLMEAWDGPAAMAFTDGRWVGAVLDRNGLRPGRYVVTHDGRLVLASETGALSIAPDNVKEKGRLTPGRLLLVDLEEGRLVPDAEVKKRVAEGRPYRRWIESQRIRLSDLAPNAKPKGFDPETLISRMRAFGYTTETGSMILLPLVTEGRDPVGSMGDDAALACLSDGPRLLYDYFKQLFAQVTNPPIDSIREEVIMSLAAYVGPEHNLLESTEAHAARLYLPHPILTNEELAAIRTMDHRGWRSKRVDITWNRKKGASGLDASLRRIAAEAEAGVDDGYQVLVLSDRRTSAQRVPISALLAVGAVHQHLVRASKRTRVALVVETGEAREVHHHACLVGYGADAINPYLAFEALWQARRQELLPTLEDDQAIVAAYRKGVAKGLLKVMAKMGISTLQSYKGAQIFEAVGLSSAVVDQCFTGTPSRIEGVGFEVLAEEAVRRHELGYPTRAHPELPVLPNDGQFHYRRGGEKHMWDPSAIATLQRAARDDDPDAYARFAEHANADAETRCTLRGLLRFRSTTPIPRDEVEPAAEIVKRFVTGAMSFGAISIETHTTLARAMNSIGGKSNSGEGGEDPARYRAMPDGTPNPLRSRIKQVASGRFGVTIEYLTSADEIQIKMAQGAKPGEGGELPGAKVDAHIARVRHSTVGVGLISPPPHHDIYSIEDLAQLIYDLKNANPHARISVKLVSEVGVGTVAAGVTKAKAEHILISGHDGGTGASPITSVKHAGVPWELGLAEAHQTLVLNDLRGRVVLQVDGQLKTGRDVVIGALLGAEEFGFSTGPLVTLGCIMMRKCHLNTCPVGIATHDPALRAKFTGQPEHVVRYLFMVAEEARTIMASLGFRTVDEMVGRVEVLAADDAIVHWKSQGLDLSPILTPARGRHESVTVRKTFSQDHGLDHAFDKRLIEIARPAIARGERVEARIPIRNVHRAVGTMLSHVIACARQGDPLPDDTIRFALEGTAGQSFGAFLAEGVTLSLEGDANDHVGKGLSGGRIVMYPPRASTFEASENIIIGNVALYGAVSGSAFFRGRAAERFAVRNSGATAVVEGIGNHGCEYMTGGRVVVLGPTGRNFAAGMSGGIAYVWDVDGLFRSRVNPALVRLERLEAPEDLDEVRTLVALHRDLTGSLIAERALESFDIVARKIIKVIPVDYARALDSQRKETSSAGEVA
jgi:glutamate synthase (NADPH/NADH) large chain